MSPFRLALILGAAAAPAFGQARGQVVVPGLSGGLAVPSVDTSLDLDFGAFDVPTPALGAAADPLGLSVIDAGSGEASDALIQDVAVEMEKVADVDLAQAPAGEARAVTGRMFDALAASRDDASGSGGGVSGWLRWPGAAGRERRAAARTELEAAAFGEAVTLTRGGRSEAAVVLAVGEREADVLVEKRGKWVRERVPLKKITGVERRGERGDAALAQSGLNAAAWERRHARNAEYRRFLARDLWAEVAPKVNAELDALSTLDKAAAREHVKEQAAAVLERLKRRYGTRNIGFHYNLHGGMASGYVEGGGIRATRGDISLQYTMSPSAEQLAKKVYFFQSAKHSLYDVLNEDNPSPGIKRMGSVLMLFRRDSEFLTRAEAEGHARNAGSISLDFDDAWLERRGDIGVPYDTFLGPPLEVFTGTRRRLGRGSLSRDEETLAVVRLIEAAYL